MAKISLLSTPWPLFNRPSIQLGSLVAYVKKNLPETDVDSHHMYLGVAKAVGYKNYGFISKSSWTAESPYASLLFPDRLPEIEKFWGRRISGAHSTKEMSLLEIRRRVRDCSSRQIDSVDWNSYKLAGFSICLGQLTSALYYMREIRKRAPLIKIAVGGSSCAGKMGLSLLKTFKDIDFVVSGEGELPLVHLIKMLEDDFRGPESYPGLLSRRDKAHPEKFSQVPDLDELPIPEYKEYFKELSAMRPCSVFIPEIPMEISRGCWWRKTTAKKKSSGCSFCNLNLHWKGYRKKSAQRVVKEMDALTSKHENLSVFFVDNLLPQKGLFEIFSGIGSLKKDLRLFSEIRAVTSSEILSVMGAAGMSQIQVGIEAMSSGLLRKMKKGTSAIDNMEIMKNCEIPGFPDLKGNIILFFPTSDERDVAETIWNLEFAFPFRPLRGVPFWLGYESDLWKRSVKYGIRRLGNHPYYSHLFPPEKLRSLHLMIQGYSGGIRRQRYLWKPVERKLEEWKMKYSQLHEYPASTPILSYLDGREFLIIRQRLWKKDDMIHRLKGLSRKLYLFCNTRKPMSQILYSFKGVGEDQIRPFLKMMIDKRLMFSEKDSYLSLAVPEKPSALHVERYRHQP